jgi:excisionase family DNA binding protein
MHDIPPLPYMSLGDDVNVKRERLSTAAARKGVHPRTIRRRIADGSIKGWRIGPRLIVVDPDEVDRELDRQIPAAG